MPVNGYFVLRTGRSCCGQYRADVIGLDSSTRSPIPYALFAITFGSTCFLRFLAFSWNQRLRDYWVWVDARSFPVRVLPFNLSLGCKVSLVATIKVGSVAW